MLNSENSLLPKVSVEEKEKIKEMIEAKKSFCVVGANNTSTVAGIIEGMVETAVLDAEFIHLIVLWVWQQL